MVSLGMLLAFVPLHAPFKTASSLSRVHISSCFPAGLKVCQPLHQLASMRSEYIQSLACLDADVRKLLLEMQAYREALWHWCYASDVQPYAC